MTSIFGHLGVADSDRVYVQTVGQELIFSAVDEYFQAANADLENALAFFVEERTSSFKERYKLLSGGRAQRRGGLTPAAARRTVGGWDVAYPLEDFGEKIVVNDIDLAYMTLTEYEKQVKGVITTVANTIRYEVRKALFNSASRTFTDERQGDLTIQPLANGDAVLYPPVLGVEDAATDNHYLESSYASASISNSNNPVTTIVRELEEHFGESTGNDNIAVLVNRTEADRLAALSSFVAVPDNWVTPGNDTAVPDMLPNIPGKIIGRMNGAWISQWAWMPAGYMYGQHLDVEAPLKWREDPPDTGLGGGLRLVAQDDRYPLVGAEWRIRFGFGVGNRLNGVMMELGTGGSYSVPAGF